MNKIKTGIGDWKKNIPWISRLRRHPMRVKKHSEQMACLVVLILHYKE